MNFKSSTWASNLNFLTFHLRNSTNLRSWECLAKAVTAHPAILQHLLVGILGTFLWCWYPKQGCIMCFLLESHSWELTSSTLCPYLSIYTAKSLQSCPTLCDPRDGSPPGSPIPGILQARTLEWVAISFSQYIHWKVVIAEESRFLELRENWSRKMCTNGSSVSLDNEQCNPVVVEISCGPKLSCSYGAWDSFGLYSVVVAANLQTFDKVLLENWVFSEQSLYTHMEVLTDLI